MGIRPSDSGSMPTAQLDLWISLRARRWDALALEQRATLEKPLMYHVIWQHGSNFRTEVTDKNITSSRQYS